MTDYEIQAAGYMRQAEAKLKKGLFKKPDYDTAAEFYDKAGNYYKVAKKYKEAAAAYLQCAEAHMSNGKPQMAVNSYNTAAALLKDEDPQASHRAFEKMIRASEAAGRFMQAGKAMKELAEMLESEGKEQEAYTLYKEALDVFSKEASAGTEIRFCKEHIAELNGRLFDGYVESSRLLEEIGTDCTKVQLLQFHARGYFLTAFLCLCITPDKLTLNMAKERYAAADPTFSGSFEEEFMTQVAEVLDEENLDAFLEATGKLQNRLGVAFKRNKFQVFLVEKIVASLDPDKGASNDVDDFL